MASESTINARPECSLEYETPLGQGQCVMGSMRYVTYESDGGGVVIIAPNHEPMGRRHWARVAMMGMAVAAMALLVVAGFSQKQLNLSLGVMRISASPFAFLAAGVLLCLFLLRIITAAVARQRGQRVVLDASPQRLVARKESGMNEEQEARLWQRADLHAIVMNGEGIAVVSIAGENYPIEVGRNLEERIWLVETLCKALAMPDLTGTVRRGFDVVTPRQSPAAEKQD